MNTKTVLLLLVVFSFVFSSCKDDNKNTNDITIDNQIEQLVYPIPTPFETTQMLQEAGAAYIGGLTNNVSSVDNYFKEKSQALNLGIFGADLAYASTYNQAQSIREIMGASKKLSDQLGLTTVIDQNIVERIENNIDNSDTLYKIINNTYYDTFNRLNNENKGAVSIMVMTGAWIESIYISTQLAATSTDMSILAQKIAEQKYTINTLVPLLEQYKTDNPDMAELETVIIRFKDFFDKIIANEDGDVSMDNEMLEELMTIAKEEREKIIAMQ